ncbi:MAG TPA: F0F1 ATP synthase subunit delta [Candidatus Angelobacter sp.]|jgi:F-type H+-transporting ATPase subunit delta|nr:F0F1 ATP synthase subunit delta [Candidatus Angelobacter sp.]
MKISKQAQREARQLFRGCLVNGLLDENRVRQCVTLVAQKQPRGYVAILSRLHRLVKLELARRNVRVENAVETSPEQAAGIRARLERQYGPGLNIQYSINPQLIGGMRVQVGSDLYDGSVKTRLDKLEQSF